MNKKDIFGDDLVAKKDDFAFLLDQSMGESLQRLKVGDRIRGEILSIGKDESFVSTGTPVDASIPTSELLDEKKDLKYKVGDIIDASVIRFVEGMARLRLRNSTSALSEVENLEDAFDMEIPVEGRVTELVKGGFRVAISGKSAFCPLGQIDLRVNEDHASYVGTKGEFIITQFENRNIVVSRKKVLELQRAEREGAFSEKNKPGDIVEGIVKRMESYGAFIEIEGGVEGLVHISEITWSRLAHPSEFLTIGMRVRAKILKIDEEGAFLKISLSIKEGGGEMDPWQLVEEKYRPGTQIEGEIAKKENFGLFVILEPGIQALLPRSSWRDSAEAAQYENKKRGDKIKAQIQMVNKGERKISLCLPEEKLDDSWREHTGKSSGFGSLAEAFKSGNSGVNSKKKRI